MNFEKTTFARRPCESPSQRVALPGMAGGAPFYLQTLW